MFGANIYSLFQVTPSAGIDKRKTVIVDLFWTQEGNQSVMTDEEIVRLFKRNGIDVINGSNSFKRVLDQFYIRVSVQVVENESKNLFNRRRTFLRFCLKI